MGKRTGVLIHSFHLQAQDWEKIMWGEPPTLMGRLPKGIKVALEEEAEILFLGCGMYSGTNGEMESEFNQQYLLDNFYKLSEFAEFQGIDLKKAKERIEQILALDKFSLSTAQEATFVGKSFEDAGIEKVVIVSSRTHAPRCLNEALKFYSRPNGKIAVHNVSIQVSDTGWAPNDDVVVFEPPHRPDDVTGNLRRKVAKMLLYPEKLLEIKKALGL